MQIVEVITELGFGGAERMLCRLALALQNLGHTVSIVCLQETQEMPLPRSSFDEAGVEIIELHKGEGFSFAAVKQLANHLRRSKAAVVHTHNPPAHHYGVLAAKLGGAPVIVNTVHGSNTLAMPLWASILYGAGCRVSQQLVAVCSTAESDFRRRFSYVAAKTLVIENGIDVEEFVRIEMRTPGAEFVFGTIGRLVSVKDHATLLRAFALVRASNTQCRLEILGCGELDADLKSMTRSLGIEHKVRFRGLTSDVLNFLTDIDAFVLSSISEGLPLSVLEAMAAGKPVVSTSVGAVSSILDSSGCGWLCEPSNPEALASTMIKASKSRNLRKMGLSGRAYVAERYTVERMARRYDALFCRLATVRNARSALRDKPESTGSVYTD
jgi:glycosyltransferase involved in cell wall biosynthesis